MSNQSRNLEIDSLKGIAVILLVTYHVVGGSFSEGLKVSEGIIREGNDKMAFIRMPLFTFLSGYLYSLRPIGNNSFYFLKKKARRLLLPMFFVGTIFAVIQFYTPGTNHSVDNWYLLHLKPYLHFWFVEALFIVFMIVGLLEKENLLNDKKNIVIVLVISSLVYVSDVKIEWFAISGASYLFPYFIVGLAISRFHLARNIKVYWGWIILSFIFVVVSISDYEIFNLRQTFFYLFMGAVSCIALIAIRINNWGLAYIGQYSFPIYLYHVFFTAGCRILLFSVGIKSLSLNLLLGATIGISGPIILRNLFPEIQFFKVLFFGER